MTLAAAGRAAQAQKGPVPVGASVLPCPLKGSPPAVPAVGRAGPALAAGATCLRLTGADGRPAAGQPFSVLDERGRVVASGTADGHGLAVVSVPPGALVVVATDAPEHGAPAEADAAPHSSESQPATSAPAPDAAPAAEWAPQPAADATGSVLELEIADDAGRPYSGPVLLLAEDGRELGAVAERGKVRRPGVPPGRYLVLPRAGGEPAPPQVASADPPGPGPANGARGSLSVSLAGGASGALALYRADGSEAASAAASGGRATLAGLPPGKYVLAAKP